MSTAIDINSSNALNHATPKTDGLMQRASFKKLAGKVGVITGGSTGMGLATAKRFVLEGMDHVFITGRRKDVLDTAVAEIGEKAGRCCQPERSGSAV